jgi:hypothetical protein
MRASTSISIILGALLVGLSFVSSTQAQVLIAPPAEGHELDALGVTAGTRQVFELPDGVEQDMALAVVLDGQSVTLQLQPHSVRGSGFRLLVAGADGVPHAVPALPSAVVRGTVEQWPGSVVTGSLRHGKLRALILPGPSEELVGGFAIDPLGDGGEHLVYRMQDVTAEEPLCGNGAEEGGWGSGVNVIGGDLSIVPAMTCDVAADSDVEFYQDLGSSVDAVSDHIETVLAGCSAIYEQQLGINLAVIAILVRTEEPDPFFSNVGSDTLDELGEHWSVFQMQCDPDLVQLFTGKNYPGIVGKGTVDGICHETNNVSLTRSLYYSGFAKQVRVSAHEFGHNFGAGHCSTQPDCGIMCPALCGPTSVFGEQSVQAILTAKLTVGCLEFAEELALPRLLAIAPESFPSGAKGGFFTLHGSGLTTVFAVEVGAERVVGIKVVVLNDETLLVSAPTPVTLGPVPVVVHTAAGRSNRVELVYGPNDPPVLQVPFSVSAGNPVQMRYAGDVGDTAVLLLSVSNATTLVGGLDVLSDAFIAKIGSLSAAAIGRYKLKAAPVSLAGLPLFSQVVMFNEQGIDAASIVRSTNVLP